MMSRTTLWGGCRATGLWRVLRGAMIAVTLLTAHTATAAAPPWADAPYSHYAQDRKLDAVLQDFAGSFSLSLNVGPGVKGMVNGRFNARNPTEFINKLASVYGFNWFTHAGTLFISRADDQKTVTVSAAGNGTAQLREALTSLGILDTRFGWGELPEQNLVLVSGPPAYVDLVERTVKSLPSNTGGQQVAVFRLKHATVDDRTIYFRDKEIRTPGVASILRNLITGASGGRGAVNNEAMAAMAAPLRSAPPVITEIGGASSGNGGAVATGTAAVAANGQAVAVGQTAVAGGTRARTPSIQADVRMNSLIVQDIPERIPVYAELIRELDVPTALIEIQAMVVDVNSERTAELGIDWGGRAGNNAIGFNTPTSSTSTTNALSVNWSAIKNAVNPSTLVVDTGNYIVTRIRALEGIGDARVQSRPSVLTLENQGAVFDHSETFYIRVQGERVASVTPITAGVTLRVTPRVVHNEGRNVIQLIVDVEDGNIQDKFVDSLPTVQRSSISTQALLDEGQSLIIGGYNREQEIERTNRIPILGEIPLIGMLFSNKSTDHQKRDRLFLIKPRIVTASAPGSAVAPEPPLLPDSKAEVTPVPDGAIDKAPQK